MSHARVRLAHHPRSATAGKYGVRPMCLAQVGELLQQLVALEDRAMPHLISLRQVHAVPNMTTPHLTTPHLITSHCDTISLLLDGSEHSQRGGCEVESACDKPVRRSE